jgi:hypothetical protein
MCFSRKSKSAPPPISIPVPVLVPTPIPEPTPEPIPPPVLVPEIPDRSLPLPSLRPPAPPLPSLWPDQYRVGDVSDIGEAIRLAPSNMEVVVTKSGDLLSPVVLLPGTRLRLAQGVVITTRTEGIPFRLMEGTSIIGESGSVIIESSVAGQFTVIAGYYGSEKNGAADSDITLQGFEVRGSAERRDFNSAPQAIALGNCKKFQVLGLWINGTHSIGIQVGGAGFDGHAAEDGIVSHCRFTRVASQSLALVNGRRIIFEYNDFDATGQFGGPGSHPIDLELNGPDDVLYDVMIRGNYIDMREAAVNGNGIIAQVSTGSQEVGEIHIEDNLLIGGNPYPPVTNMMSNGIYVFGATMRNATIKGNRIWRTGQSGLNLEGAGIVCTDNELVNVGGGGLPGVLLNSLRKGDRESEFYNNTFRWTGDGPQDNRILKVNCEVKMENNPGFNVVG